MQMIPGVVLRKQAVGMGRIARDLIEVDDLVEVAGRPNPLIDCLPVGLAARTRMIVVRPRVRKNRSPYHLDSMSMGSKNDLLVRLFDPANQSTYVLPPKPRHCASARPGR